MLSTASETLDQIDFRLAKARDIDGLVELLRAFFYDSDLPTFGLSFDPIRTEKWLDRVIISGRFPHFIALDRETVVGSLSYSFTHSFSNKPIAEMDKFYVLKNWRHSAIGRVLLALTLEDAKREGAGLFRAGVSSGIPGSANIFRKFGFRETPHSILLGKEL